MKKWAKRFVFLFLLLLLISALSGGGIYLANRDIINGVPLVATSDLHSLKHVFPFTTARSAPKLDAARHYADRLRTTAVIAIHDGHLVAEWSATHKRISGHSVRKSLVSALYGIAVQKGLININRTLAELGIDDHNPPLSDQEKQARLADLLTARSGIYHPSIKDDNGEAPARGSHPPLHGRRMSF